MNASYLGKHTIKGDIADSTRYEMIFKLISMYSAIRLNSSTNLNFTLRSFQE